MIDINKLSASYSTINVLQNLSLNIDRGTSYVLIGPSGCGKSTLMRILCGIHKNYTGSILYEGKPLSERQVSIGYVPQAYGLLNWKTVAENIYLPFRLDKEKNVNEKEAEEIIKILGINDLLSKYPLQLSGGQRQRVALARAFISQPDLLLMDEPFSSLDSFTSVNSQKLFLQLWKKYNITTIIITHNVNEAVNLGEHILIMDKTSGNIVKQIENSSFTTGNKTLKLQTTEEVMSAFNAIVE